MVVNFFVILQIESGSGTFMDVQHIFHNIVDEPLIWLAMAFCIFVIIIEEIFYKAMFLLKD